MVQRSGRGGLVQRDWVDSQQNGTASATEWDEMVGATNGMDSQDMIEIGRMLQQWLPVVQRDSRIDS